MSNTDNKYTLIISSSQDHFYNISKHVGIEYTKQYTGTDTFAQTRLQEVVITRNTNNEIFYGIPYDKPIRLQFNDKIIECLLVRISDYLGTSYGVSFLSELRLTSDNEKIIEEFIHLSLQCDSKLSIFHYNTTKEFWKKFGEIQHRDESTLIINMEDRDKIMTDVDSFVNSEKDYIKYGIPYKRNYLFYGKPGTGKTSLAKIIAHKTKRSIYILSFDVHLTDNGLYNAINTIHDPNSILLLEDIDCIFQERMSKAGVSFSCLLNVLDGLSTPHGLISIITTNYADKLDKALIRPGRVDMAIKFSTISKEQINGLFELYEHKYSSKIIDKFVKICTNKNLSASTLTGFLFRHRNFTLNNDNIIKLFNDYLNELDTINNDNTYKSNIYI